MKRISRDTWLTVGLISLLLVITSIVLFRDSRRAVERPALSSSSTRPNGARALWLWLEKLGYTPTMENGPTFTIPQNATLALILEPQLPGITEAEWAVIDEWVEAGGTLLLVGEGFGAAFAVRRYDLEIVYLEGDSGHVEWNTPLFLSPPPTVTDNIRPRAVFHSERPDIAPVLSIDGQPALVTLAQGDGLVILSTLTYPFTNEGLSHRGNAQFALNLARLAAPSGTIWFDEWHHGVRSAEAGSLQGPGQWLRQSPAGRSLLFAAAAIFVVLILRGQSFGRPLPLPAERRRRAPAEHITALANLNRRAGHRHAVLQRYHRQLKLQLGRRYRLSTSLPDEEFVAQLAAFRPELEREKLLRLLERLHVGTANESEMVQLAREAVSFPSEQ